MNWILEHLQLVIIVASAFAWWLTQRRRESEDQPPPPREGRGGEFEELERTRRIQEDIRRKIAERRATGRGAAQPPPVPVRRPAERSFERPLERPAPPRRDGPEWTQADAAAMERQRRLQDQMREAQERREAARAQVRQAFSQPAVGREWAQPGTAIIPRGSAWVQLALHDPASARRAIVLREVLGPPVGLRR